MRLRLWSPLPPSSSGIADYVSESLPALAAKTRLQVVVETPAAVDPSLRERYLVVSPAEIADADLDLYHVGNSPEHGYVYRRALAEPGVVVLHEWSLHHLVLHETLERGDVSAYLREMRRAHGEEGTFVGRQVARALGGDVLPALFPLNDRLLEASLAVVSLTTQVARRTASRLPGRKVLHLPHHLSLPHPLPSREEARQALGLPAGAFVVTAPGLCTPAKGLDATLRAVRSLAARVPSLLFVVAGAALFGFDPRARAVALGLSTRVVHTGRLSFPDFVGHLCAADVVLSLRFPSHGEMSGALVRALGVGRPVLVTAGTPAAEEFPAGIVVPIDPGPREEAELAAFLQYLHAHVETRETMGRLARAHVQAHHGLEETVAHLVEFLHQVAAHAEEGRQELRAARTPEDGLFGYFMEEVRGSARDLGVLGMRLGLEPLLRGLARGGA